jgi:non-heme chloroperoxidase
MKTLLICVALVGAHPWALWAQESKGLASTKTIRANDEELHYVDQGRGTPVVLVHGGLEDYRSWEPQMEAFSQHHRTIAYSRRHNYPNRRSAPGDHYSAIADADDLAALIEGLGIAPAHVVGVSYGAYAALLLATRHPTLVRSLVLCEPPLLRWLPDLPGGQPLFAEFMTKVWEPATRGFREGDEAGVRAAVDGFGQVGYLLAGEKATFAALPPDVRTLLLDDAAEWRGLTQSKDAFPTVAQSAVAGIRAPTLMLSGERTMPLHKLIDKRLESLLPHHQRIVLSGASHEMWSEKPEECRKAVLTFLAAH